MQVNGLAELPQMYITTLLEFMTHPGIDNNFMVRNWNAAGCYYNRIEDCLTGHTPEDSRWNSPVTVLWSETRTFAYVTTTRQIDGGKVGITFVHKSLIFK